MTETQIAKLDTLTDLIQDILADEPTGNLDTRAGAKVFEIIRALHAEGNTIVLITHDEGLARKAQRIVRITDGKIDDGEREVF